MMTHNFAQTTPHPVAHHCASNSSRSDEAGTKSVGAFSDQHAEGQRSPAIRAALLPDAFEFRRAPHVAGFRK